MGFWPPDWQRRGQPMPNPADDLRDQAFCQALCYGHVSLWEPAALSKRPELIAARPDQGTGAGPNPQNKEHPKHLAQSLWLHFSLQPSLFVWLFLNFFILPDAVLLLCFLNILSSYELRVSPLYRLSIAQLVEKACHVWEAMFIPWRAKNNKKKKKVLRSVQLWGPVSSRFSHEAESSSPGTLPADQGLLEELGMFPPQEPGPNLVPKKDFWGYGATALEYCHYSTQVLALFIHVLYIIHHVADWGPTMSSAWFE